MLRSELVYQLKKSIEQNPEFTLEQSYEHILIDEYQDLNRCDLEVIKMLTTSGAHLYASGDDDQSIYGFRFAYPQGIRMFGQDYSPCEVLPLENCIRCGDNILQIALFVARLDVSRIEKTLIAYNTGQPSEVHLLNFSNQIEESQCIAQICRYLIEAVGIAPKDILILTRSNRNGIFSSVLKEALSMANVPVATQADVDNPLDQDEGRIFLSFLRLLVNPRDHLALLTIFKIRNNGIGDQTISKIYEFALAKGLTFIDALVEILNSPDLLGINRNTLQREYESIRNTIIQFQVVDTNTSEELTHFISSIADTVIENQDLRKEAINYLQPIVTASEITNLRDLLATISTSLGDKEQDIDVNCVNIMTMHGAKGLTAEAVFIVGAEDEYLPGDQIGGEKEGDERRLLYVSLTRAKRYLYITYCNRRTNRQMWSGRTTGQTRRTLSRFLVDSPLRPKMGGQYLRELT
ncbi:ATP-dependent helicase [Chloroflexota bacterium]